MIFIFFRGNMRESVVLFVLCVCFIVTPTISAAESGRSDALAQKVSAIFSGHLSLVFRFQSKEFKANIADSLAADSELANNPAAQELVERCVNLIRTAFSTQNPQAYFTSEEAAATYGKDGAAAALTISYMLASDFAKAKESLAGAQGHVLHSGLSSVLQKMEVEQQAKEKLSAAFKSWWPETGDSLPDASEIRRLALLPSSVSQASQRQSELNALVKSIGGSEIYREYAAVIELYAKLLRQAIQLKEYGAKLADARIISVDPSSCTATTTADTDFTSTPMAGIFIPEQILYSVSADQPVLLAGTADPVERLKPLSMRSFTIPLRGSSSGSSGVQVGQPMIVGKDLKKQTYCLGKVANAESGAYQLRYSTDFNENFRMGTFWETLPGAVVIKNNQMVLNVSSDYVVKGGNAGDLRFKTDFQCNYRETKFDTSISLTGERKIAIFFSSGFHGNKSQDGGLTIILGQNESESGARPSSTGTPAAKKPTGRLAMASGIYAADKLIAEIPERFASGRKYELSFGKREGGAFVTVNGKDYFAKLPEAIAEMKFFTIVIECKGELAFDYFKVWTRKTPVIAEGGGAATGNTLAEIIAADILRQRLLIAPGSGKEWENLKDGRPVYFLVSDDPNSRRPNFVVLGTAKIERRHGKYFIVNTDEAIRNNFEDILNEAFISLAPNKGVPEAEFIAYASAKRSEQGSLGLGDIIKGKVVKGGTGSAILTVPGDLRLSGNYYCYKVGDKLVHPVSSELLGVKVGSGGACEMKSQVEGVRAAFSDKTILLEDGEHIIICADRLPFGGIADFGRVFCDIPAWKNSSLSSTLDIVNGEWAIKGGRLWTSSPTDKGGAPMAVFKEPYKGNFQFDFNVCVEKPTKQYGCQFVKDISVMLFSPKDQKGLTIGLGAEGFGGVAVDRGTPSTDSTIEHRFKEYQRMPVDAKARGGHSTFVAGEMEARIRSQYAMRLRKIGDSYHFYANGKLLLSEAFPAITDDVQVWLLAPESVLSFGSMRVRDLPANIGKGRGPLLGDFGYVIAYDKEKAEIICDADIGLGKGDSVTVVEVIEELREPGTNELLFISLRGVAQATLNSVGRALATAKVSGSGVDLKPGMKILPGKYPLEEFKITAADFANIDKGL